MPPRSNHLRTLGWLSAVAMVVWAVHVMRASPVHIGTAIAALNAHGGSARVEDIRYTDHDLVLRSEDAVVDGQLDPHADPSAQALWAVVRQTLPPAAVSEIRQLNLVTDGPGSTLAMVHRSAAAHDAWVLSIDYEEKTAVIQRTLVHELGHMYTLTEGDLDPKRSDCKGELIAIGCARAGSLLAGYVDDFWKGVPEPARYTPDSFVSEYAAESAHEDLAETFMFYVYGDGRTTPVIQAKFAWFDRADVFRDARAEIRAQLNL